MQMGIIQRRLRALEASRAGCKCRLLQVTFFHSFTDLQRIMRIRCPLHVFCDLGELAWAPPGMPLRMEDRRLCCCSPSPTREWLEGKRGPLTEEEQAHECLSWLPTVSEDPEEELQVEIMLNNYQKAKRRGNAMQW